MDTTDTKTRLAQSLTIITGVQLQETPDGVEIILETASGEILQGVTSVEGNSLIVDLPNAQLQLLEGNEFTQENPIEGIASVNIVTVDENNVRITVTGDEVPPEGEIISTEQGLTLSIISPIPEIVIISTAEKRPENVQNIPISITILTREQIEDADVRSLRDAAALTPNFFTSLGDRSFNFQTIRGLGNSNYLVRDAISVYIDDVPYENIHQFLPGELFDLERIEILRGPQGTLYGRSSQAGVINIISRPPSDTLEFNIGGGYGNYNQRQVQLSVSDTPIQDKFGYRLSFAYNARDGFTENTLLDEDANEQSSLYGRANFLWKPSKEWSVAFNSNVASNQDGDNTFVPIDQSNPFESQSNIPGYLDVAVNTQSLRIGYEGESVNVTSITARNDTNLNYQQDTDYTADDLLRSDSRIPSTIWSQEIRVQSPNSAERFRWLLGGYYQSRSIELGLSTEYRPLVASLGFPVGTDRTDARFDQETYAIFGQVDVEPIDRLVLTAGLRYEKFRDELARTRSFEDSELGEMPTGDPLRNSVDGDVVLPRFAIQYRVIPNVNLYGTIAQGYKPGTQNFASDDLSTLVVRPENLWSYELGVKTSWLNDRITANLAVFWSNVDDYQILLTDETGFATLIANGNVETSGVELEVNAKIIQGLDVFAGFGYTNARFTQYTNPFTGENFNGNKLTYAPDFTFNFGVQYRHPIGIFARVDLQGIGTYYFDDANRLKQDPFTLVNTRIGYEWQQGGFYLYANNLFQTEYITTAFSGFFADLASYGDRRTFGFQVRLDF
ncbi:similar to TonB-dependent receptor [Chroococcus sp. FPU101]|nr:similar to TonB-dependent receptor [Chroococcus sp. FPU101]